MSFSVIYPRANCVVGQSWFLAYGRGPSGVGELTGVIYDATGKAVAQGSYVASKSGKLWILSFDQVPLGKRYQLVVRELQTGRMLATVGPFDVQKLLKFIGISYPTSSDMPVSSDFLVWGPTDVSVALSATIDGMNGDYLSGPPDQPKRYMFEFTGVPTGTGYTLTVSGGGSTTTETVDVA